MSIAKTLVFSWWVKQYCRMTSRISSAGINTSKTINGEVIVASSHPMTVAKVMPDRNKSVTSTKPNC